MIDVSFRHEKRQYANVERLGSPLDPENSIG